MLPNVEMIKKIVPNAIDVREVKVGGQKAVFRAIDSTNTQLAVKIMLPEGSDDRLLREIKIVTENDFPNVPRVISSDYLEFDNQRWLYIIEPFLEGMDLRGVLTTTGVLSLSSTLKLLTDLFETVAAMEIKGIVHRDIKPENILSSQSGKYWLLDFGIARDLRNKSLTATAAHFGPHTAGYAAPEQFRNLKKKIDSKADLFSIGVVAYEVITGNHPFSAGARDYLDVLKRTESMNVERLSIDGDKNNELASFISILMEKYPSRRPPNAGIAKGWFQQIMRNLGEIE